MAFIPVVNNYTGDEAEIHESWLERWPDDFTPIKDAAPAAPKSPSTGTHKEK